MTTVDFVIELFCRNDDAMKDIHKHPQACLYPSELATLAFMFAIKGVGNRAFYRWLERDWKPYFPNLPERTRLFRLFKTHRYLTLHFLAEPTILGIIDSYGIELIHPIREGRCEAQIGKKGKSNHRWIVGCKLCLVVNQFGLITSWDCDTANVHDTTFQPLVQQFENRMIILGDQHFHAKEGDPDNLKICLRGNWNDRMLIETVFSMLTLISHFKKVMHRKWEYFKMRMAFTVAAFNLLVQWNGLKADENGFVPLSIAEFSL
jgi:hypothetical protein